MTEAEPAPELVRRAQTGDRAAFDGLVGRFEGRLRASVANWAQFRLGPPLDVDEVVQDTFVRAFSGIGSFEWQGEDAFFRWLCGVAKRSLSDSARHAHRAALKKAPGISATDLAAEGPTQSRVMRREERFARFEAALRDLPPDYRRALALARLEGLTLKEIGEAMGRTPTAVKHLVARALRELRRRFGETGSLHLPPRRLNVNGESHDG